jgi:hypothetical protein
VLANDPNGSPSTQYPLFGGNGSGFGADSLQIRHRLPISMRHGAASLARLAADEALMYGAFGLAKEWER